MPSKPSAFFSVISVASVSDKRKERISSLSAPKMEQSK